jgi:F-type H+-transporting ATPase subunit delta
MSAHRTTEDFAMNLVSLSLDETGQVSEERVGAILKSLRARPTRNLKQLLKNYLRYIAREIRKGQAVVEYSGEVGPAEIREIERSLSRRYGRTITSVLRENPQLLAGVRVSVADDIFDASVAGHLERLANRGS